MMNLPFRDRSGMQDYVPERQAYQQYNEEENVFQADGIHVALGSLLRCRLHPAHRSTDTDGVWAALFTQTCTVVE